METSSYRLSEGTLKNASRETKFITKRDERASRDPSSSVIAVMASLSSNPSTLWDSLVKRARYYLKVSSLSCRIDRR